MPSFTLPAGTRRPTLRRALAGLRAALLAVLSFPVLLTAVLLLAWPLLLPTTASLAQPLTAARTGLALHLGVYVLGAVLSLVGVLSALHAMHAARPAADTQAATPGTPAGRVRAWRSVGRAYRDVGRVLAAAAVLGGVAAVGLYGWYLTPVAGLAWLGLVQLRHHQDPARRRPRRSDLLWLIPFFPVLYALLLSTVLPVGALSRPRSVARSLLAGHAQLTRHWRAAGLALVLAGGAVSAVTVAATKSYALISGPSTGFLGTAAQITGRSLLALAVVYLGLALACALWAVTFLWALPAPPAPATTAAAPGRRGARTRLLTWSPRLLGGAASVAVLSLLASPSFGGVAHAATLPDSPAASSPTTTADASATPSPSASPVAEPSASPTPADASPSAGTRSAVRVQALAAPATVPTLQLGLDGSDPNLSLYASVSVDTGLAPQGTVQFLDNGTPIGAPVTLAPAYTAMTSEAYGQANNLTAGNHQLSFTYTPTDPTVVAGGTSPPTDHAVKAGTTITLTAPAGTTVDGPAAITVTVTSATAGAFPTAPDGDVTLQSLGAQTTLTLTDGQATWNLPSLPDASVDASYAGSALYLPSTVTTDVVSGVQASYDTELTVSPSQPSFPLGSAAPVTVTVSAPTAPYGSVIAGTVELFAPDGVTSLGTAPVSGGQASLDVATDTLGVGAAALTATFTASSGFNSSTTTLALTLTPASTSINFGVKPAGTPVYGTPYHVRGTLSSSLSDVRTVRLEATTLDGTASIVGTQQVSVQAGTAAVDFTLTTELAASLHYDLRLLVTGDASHLAASSAQTDTYFVAVAPAATTTTLSTRVVGTSLRVSAAVSSPAVPAGRVFGQVTFRVNDIEEFGPYPLSYGVASFTYTPISSAPLRITASYHDPAPARTFLPSTAAAGPLSLDLDAGTPVMSWTDAAGGAPTLLSSVLHVTYPGVPGTFAPSGVVSVRDASGAEVAQITLHRGQGASQALRPYVNAQYFLSFAGDGIYRPQFVVAPALGLEFAPQLSLTGPTSAVPLGTATTFALDLSGVDVRLVTATSISDQVNGVTTVLDASCCPQGSGTFTTTLPEGAHTLVATVSFGTLGVVTASTQVTVTPDAPTISLRVLTPASEQQLGKPIQFEATALVTSSGKTGFTAFMPVVIQDADGSRAQASWVFDADGAHATLSLLARTPGAHRVTATSSYGMFGSYPTSSDPVSFTLAPQPHTASLELVPSDNAYSRNLTVEVVPQGSVVADTGRGLPYQLPATLTLTSSNPKAPAQSQQVQLTYDYTKGRYLNYSATTLGQQLPGVLTLTLTVAGDGRWVAPSTAMLKASVAQRRTQVVLDKITAGHSSGQETTVAAHVEALPQDFYDLPPLPLSSPLPVTVSLDGGATTCTTVQGACELPFTPMKAGVHTLTLAYAGDDVAAPASRTVTYVEELRPSYLTVRVPDSRRTYQVGDPVTVTWQASVHGPLDGTVTVRAGSAHCSAAAAVGTCALTLTADSAGRAQTYAVLSGVYTSADPGTATATSTGTVLFAGCMPLAVSQGSYTIKSGAHCKSDRTGVLAGTVITLTANVPPSTQALDYWKNTLDPDAAELPPAVRNGTVDAVVSSPSQFAPSYTYRPICYLLEVPTYPGAANDPSAFPAWLRIDTAPNCTNPQLASEQELYDRDNFGRAYFAAGTKVELSIATRGRSNLVFDTLTGGATTVGASQYSGARFGTVTMDKDRVVEATFKSPYCTTTPLLTSEFGTLTVTSALRPNDPPGMRYQLRPVDGSCTTFHGEKGYVPGTELTVKVKAKPGYGVRAVYAKDNPYGRYGGGSSAVWQSFTSELQVGDAVSSTAPVNLPGVLAGEDVGPSEQTITLTVPKDGLRIDGFSGRVSNLSTLEPATLYGAVFAHAACVKVHVHLAYVAPTRNGAATTTAPQPGPLGDACGGAGWTALGDRAQPFTGGYHTQEYVGQVPVDHSLGIWISTLGYLPAKQSTPTAVMQIDRRPAEAPYVPLNSDYYGTNGGVPSDVPHPAYVIGTSAAALLSAQQRVDFYVTWHSKSCRKPLVETPDGGSYRIQSAAHNYACADPTTFAPDQPLIVAATPPGGSDYNVRAVISLGHSGQDPNADKPDRASRRYFATGQPVAFPTDQRGLRINFCAPLNAGVSFRTSYGEPLDYSPLTEKQVNPETIYQSGSCPLGMGAVGAKTYIGLRGDVAKSFRLTASPEMPRSEPKYVQFLPDGSVRPPTPYDWDVQSSHYAIELDVHGRHIKDPWLAATLQCYQVKTGPRVWLHTDLPCPSKDPYTGRLGAPRQADTWVMAGAQVEVGVDLSSTEKVSNWHGLRSGESRSSQNAAFVMNGPDREVSVDVRNLSTGEAIGYIMSSVAQRVAAGVLQYVVGGLLAEIGVLDAVKALAVGVSKFLDLVGIDDGAGDWAQKLSAGVDISLGTLKAFTTCSTAWSTGGGGSTGAGGVLSGASSGAGAVKTGLGVISHDKLLGDGIVRQTSQQAGAAGDALETLAAAADLFGSNTAAYFADPAQSWGNLAPAIGSCMGDHIDEQLKRF